tara:strand:- start:52 stop:219 length:168 start_codon:yes stop_codon:yes gene_type:complete
MTQTTQELKTKLEELIQTYNEAVQTQNKTKEAVIAIQAVIQDREDGNTDDSNSTD